MGQIGAGALVAGWAGGVVRRLVLELFTKSTLHWVSLAYGGVLVLKFKLAKGGPRLSMA